jgi:hypothetical protein
MEAWWLLAPTGRAYCYSFSLYLPADFPIVPERLVLARWKQLCKRSRCRPQNPVLAVRYQDGELVDRGSCAEADAREARGKSHRGGVSRTRTSLRPEKGWGLNRKYRQVELARYLAAAGRATAR